MKMDTYKVFKQQEEIVKQPEHYLIAITAALWDKVLEHEKYPAQMLEVAGDLHHVPAKFENPAFTKTVTTTHLCDQATPD